MKIALTGANGFIGKAFLKERCIPLHCNILEYNDVDRAISQVKPDIVLHLAGKSDPEWVEKHHEQASKANVRGTYYVMENCAKYRIPAILLSSAQVWNGGWMDLFNSHSETSRRTFPVNSYGMQKVAAEAMTEWMNANGYHGARVIRTSFVFNRERLSKELNDLKRGFPIDAPRFLKRSFIHLDDFVPLVLDYCHRFYDMPQVLHLAGSETVSYCDFWMEVCKQFELDRKLVKGRRFEKDIYDARRPHNGGLDVSLSRKLGFKQVDYVGGIGRMKDE